MSFSRELNCMFHNVFLISNSSYTVIYAVLVWPLFSPSLVNWTSVDIRPYPRAYLFRFNCLFLKQYIRSLSQSHHSHLFTHITNTGCIWRCVERLLIKEGFRTILNYIYTVHCCTPPLSLLPLCAHHSHMHRVWNPSHIYRKERKDTFLVTVINITKYHKYRC